jgi:hypothetical protein
MGTGRPFLGLNLGWGPLTSVGLLWACFAFLNYELERIFKEAAVV